VGLLNVEVWKVRMEAGVRDPLPDVFHVIIDVLPELHQAAA